LRPETQAAIRAAGIAQRIADSRAGADHVTSKGGIDLVTDTDLACEDAIRAELSRNFPEYAVIGEERQGTVRPGQPYWLVDPICGTRPFASKRALLLKRWYVWRFSSSLAYAYLALGRIAGVIQFSSHPPADAYGSVHAAAGCFIAREAGAVVTDLDDGSPWHLTTASFLIASSAELHEELLRTVLMRQRNTGGHTTAKNSREF